MFRVCAVPSTLDLTELVTCPACRARLEDVTAQLATAAHRREQAESDTRTASEEATFLKRTIDRLEQDAADRDATSQRLTVPFIACVASSSAGPEEKLLHSA